MRPRCLPWLTSLAATAMLLGCAREAPGPSLADAYPVRGRITFADKTPLKGGVIYFTPTEIKAQGLIRYEAASLIDADGKYTLGFNGDGSGAAAGDYKVTIMPRDYQELRNSNSQRIPPRYREQATTPLTVAVKEEDNTFNFELK